MPTLWERTVFFATGRLPTGPGGPSLSGDVKPQSVAAEIRDNLLGQSLDILTEWKTALGRASSDEERSELGSFYKNQLGVLNGVFDAIRAADSTIKTRIDIDQVERAVEQQAQAKNTPHYGETEWRLTMANEPSAHEAPQFRNASEKTLDIEQLAELRNSLTDGNSSPEFSTLLAEQAVDIRAEWQRDLESGRHSQHALESYFAGKIDQHNSLIEMALQAHPELQQSLPPTINYITLRDELQHHIKAAKAQQVSIQPELAAAGYGVSI